MTLARYLVTGARVYRGHTAGTVFEAPVGRRADARAVTRGDLVLVGCEEPSLPGSFRLPRPGSFRLPPGETPDSTHREAPVGASSIEGSK